MVFVGGVGEERVNIYMTYDILSDKSLVWAGCWCHRWPVTEMFDCYLDVFNSDSIYLSLG